VRIECAAQLRVYTEDREVIRRDLLEAETQRLCTAGEVHVCAGACNRRGLEYPELSMSLHSGTEMPTPARLRGKVVLNAHQFVRVWVWQRVQQRGVDHAIDRGGVSMPSAIVAIAMKENPGDLRSMRTAYRRSKSRFSKKGGFARHDGAPGSPGPSQA